MIGANVEIVSRPTTANNVLRAGGVVDAVLEQTFVDVHSNNFTKHHPGGNFFASAVQELMNLRAFALKGHRAFFDPWDIDQRGGDRREPSQIKFVHVRWNRRAGLIHLLSQRASDQIPNKSFRLFNVAKGVFVAVAGKANDGRDIIKTVKEAVRCQIDLSSRALGRNPTNGARPNDGVEGVVR